ncbi:MAG TPA: hypothetical protein VMT03_01280 [Polyangia bacterium]|nr:hypothetical protein [Polyangia bacterium]
MGVTAAGAACALENTADENAEDGFRVAKPTAVATTATEKITRREVRFIAFLCIELDELSSGRDACHFLDLDNLGVSVKNSG